MSDIVPFSKAQLPSVFAEVAAEENDELIAGVQGGFAVISFRGRVWRVKYKGEEKVVTNSDGEPKASLELVMLKAAKNLSKQYYAKQYTEGDDSEPDCWSPDGIAPDPNVQNPVSTSCATCPKNVFGSKITDNGSKAKACSDMRRVAVVPYPDLKNEAFGGPMLLRVPPSALSELAALANKLKAAGLPYYAAVLKVSFDLDASYPKLHFNTTKIITDEEEAKIILEMRNSPEVDFIIKPPSGATSNAAREPETRPKTASEVIKAAEKAEPAKDAPAKQEKAEPATSVSAEPAAEAPADVDALVASLLESD